MDASEQQAAKEVLPRLRWEAQRQQWAAQRRRWKVQRRQRKVQRRQRKAQRRQRKAQQPTVKAARQHEEVQRLYWKAQRLQWKRQRHLARERARAAWNDYCALSEQLQQDQAYLNTLATGTPQQARLQQECSRLQQQAHEKRLAEARYVERVAWYTNKLEHPFALDFQQA